MSGLDLNALFVQWLEERHDELTAKGTRTAHAYLRALAKIRVFPDHITTPRQLLGIPFVGAKLGQFLCRRLAQHCADHALAVPAAFCNHTGHAEGGRRAHELDAAPPAKRRKAPPPYVPRRRSGPWAILVALHTRDRARRGLRKADVIAGAEAHCDQSFTANAAARDFHSAWAGVKTLVRRGLVHEHGRPKTYVLTAEGAALAAVLLRQEGVHSLPARGADTSFDNGVRVTPSSSVCDTLAVLLRDTPSSPLRRRGGEGLARAHGSLVEEDTTAASGGSVEGTSAGTHRAFLKEKKNTTAFGGLVEENTTAAFGGLMEENTTAAFGGLMEENTTPAFGGLMDETSAGTHGSLTDETGAGAHTASLKQKKDTPAFAGLVDETGAGAHGGLIETTSAGTHTAFLKQKKHTAAHESLPDEKSAVPPELQPRIITQPARALPPRPHDAAHKTYAGISYDVWAPADFDVVLLLDNREIRSKSERDFFHNKLSARGVACDVRGLAVGDVLWVARHKLTRAEAVLNYVCERKRIDDLASSIRDGRFAEQKARLKRSGIKNIHYLVEEAGLMDALRVVDMKASLDTTIAMVITVSRFYMQRFRKVDDTVEWLAAMSKVLLLRYLATRLLVLKPTHVHTHDAYLRMLQDFRPKFETRSTPYECVHLLANYQDSLLKSSMTTVKEIFVKMLMLVRGVSFDKALLIQRHFHTPRALIEFYLENDALTEDEKGALIWDKFKHEVGPRKFSKPALVAMYEAWGKATC